RALNLSASDEWKGRTLQPHARRGVGLRPTPSQQRRGPISASIETGALDNQCLQGGPVDGVTLVEIDGTYRLAVQTRVEEPFRILELGPFWKRQPHGVLEGLAYADDAVVGPDGDSFGAGGL